MYGIAIATILAVAVVTPIAGVLGGIAGLAQAGAFVLATWAATSFGGVAALLGILGLVYADLYLNWI